MAKIEKSETTEVYLPSSAVKKAANVKEYDKLYAESIKNREDFWAKQAKSLSWYKKWNTVLDDSNAPFYQ